MGEMWLVWCFQLRYKYVGETDWRNVTGLVFAPHSCGGKNVPSLVCRLHVQCGGKWIRELFVFDSSEYCTVCVCTHKHYSSPACPTTTLLWWSSVGLFRPELYIYIVPFVQKQLHCITCMSIWWTLIALRSAPPQEPPQNVEFSPNISQGPPEQC